MAEVKEPEQKFHITPLPETTRGYGKILYACKNGYVYYGNGKSVVVRSLDNPKEGYQFHEHKANVNVASPSPNGEWVASGDAEGTVLIWGTRGDRNVKTTVAVCGTVLDIQWSPDGKRVVAVGDGKQDRAKVFMWDSGSNVGKIQGHSKAILSCAYKPTRPFRIATASEDLEIKFFNGPPFKFDHTFAEHARYPNLIRYSPDGNTLISVGADSKIFVFDGKTGEKTGEIADKKNGHKSNIASFAFSPDGTQILTASLDKTAKIWNLADGTVATTFTFAAKPQVTDMQVGALWFKEHLVSVSLSGAMNFLDVDKPDTPKLILAGHKANINDLSIDKANKKFYTCDTDGQLAQWDVETGLAKWFSGKGHGGKTVSGCAVSSDGATVTTVGLDDTLRVNKVDTLEFGEGEKVGGKPNFVATGNANADLAVVGVFQQKLVFTRGGKVVSSTEIPYVPWAAEFNADDTQLIVGGKDKKTHVYSVEKDTPTETAAYDAHGKDVTAVSWEPNGKYITSAAKDRTIYNFEGGKELNKTGWQFHTQVINDVSWNPAGTKVVSGSQDESIMLWKDIAGWSQERDTIKGAHKGGVLRTRFLDDNTLVSVGGSDRAIKTFALP